MGGISLLVQRYRVSGDPLFTERRVELIALVLTLLLMVQLLYSIGSLALSQQPESKLPSADTLVIGELQRYAVMPLEQSADVKARPVFWEGRRPVNAEGNPPVTAENSTAQKNELDKVSLLGIFGGGDSAGVIALVQGKKKRILLGDKMVGWTLESIGTDHAVFTDSGKSQKLMLIRSNDPVVPVPNTATTSTAKRAEGAKATETAGPSFGANPKPSKD